LINKKEIIFKIQNTKAFTKPNIKLEQYCIDAECAVDIIYFAGVSFDDIYNRLIIDLGAGTGRISIACSFLHPELILSVDIDKNALSVLLQNVNKFHLNNKIFPLCTDINNFEISKFHLPSNLKITTIMNPPFGVKKPKADRNFLAKAFLYSDVVYSIHLRNKKVQSFIAQYVKNLNWKIDYTFPYNMILERSFQFHKHKTKKIDVDIYRFIKNNA
jgi:putative methylase